MGLLKKYSQYATIDTLVCTWIEGIGQGVGFQKMQVDQVDQVE